MNMAKELHKFSKGILIVRHWPIGIFTCSFV